ncbi:MAG: hypothetical protein ACJARZ_001679 [Dokdonia sp.]|jgi:hypothetical protein
MKYFPVYLILLFTTVVAGQNKLPTEKWAVDDSLGLALIHTSIKNDMGTTTSQQKGKNTYTLSKEENTLQPQGSIAVKNSDGRAFKTFITSIPLIQIDAPQGIVDEPKRLAQIKYTDADTTFTSYAGIELRGSSSLIFAKKTYDLNFYKDSTGNKNVDVQLAGMRNDDDWVLDGLFNEPLRMRSYLSLNLWNEIYQPYYLDREPKAKAGAQGTYADVFVNGKYQGIFLLQEQVDRKLTRINKIKDDIVRGELFQGASYNGAVTFDSLPKKKNYLPFWGGYNVKYPVPTNIYWDNLYPFTDFVINSSNDAFAKAIPEKFHLDNAVNYFLFINAVRAPDNLGKNLFLIRYTTNEPYFYAPWDLDGSFGTIFSGKRIPTTNDFLQNGLLRRLIATNAEGFVSNFQQRWSELRTGVFATEAILKRQEDVYNKLLENKVFEREALVWKEFKYDREGLEYMQQWTQERLHFLDTYITTLSKTKK